jgi:hypothetical protein
VRLLDALFLTRLQQSISTAMLTDVDALFATNAYPGLLLVTVGFNLTNRSTFIEPSLEETLSALDAALPMPQLPEKLLRPLQFLDPSIVFDRGRVHAHADFGATLARMKQKVNEDYEQLSAFLAANPWIAELASFASGWQDESLLGWSARCGDIQTQLLRFQEWTERVRLLKVFARTTNNVLCLDCRPLLASAQPRLAAISRDLDDLLTNQIFSESERLLADVEQCSSDLSSNICISHPTAEEYAHFVAGVTACKRRERELRPRLETLEDLFLQRSRIDADKAQPSAELTARLAATQTTIHSRWSELQGMLSAGAQLVNVLAPMMTHKLKMSVTEQEQAAKELLLELDAGSYIQPACRASKMMNKLRDMSQRIRQVRVRQETLCEALQIVSGKTVPLSFLGAAEALFESRKAVWGICEELTEHCADWLKKPFLQLDIAHVFRSLISWDEQACTLLKKMKNDGVLLAIRGRIDSFLRLDSILRQLAAGFYSDRHWRLLFAGLGRSLAAGQPFTIRTLQSLGIWRHSALVARIHDQAGTERNIMGLCEAVATPWRTARFSFQARRLPLAPLAFSIALLPPRTRWILAARRIVEQKQKAAAGNVAPAATATIAIKVTDTQRSPHVQPMTYLFSTQHSLLQLASTHLALLKGCAAAGEEAIEQAAHTISALREMLEIVVEIIGSVCHCQTMWLFLLQALQPLTGQHAHHHSLPYGRTQQMQQELKAQHTHTLQVLASVAVRFSPLDRAFREVLIALCNSPLVSDAIGVLSGYQGWRFVHGEYLRKTLMRLSASMTELVHVIADGALAPLQAACPRLGLLPLMNLVRMSVPAVEVEEILSLFAECFSNVACFEFSIKDSDEALVTGVRGSNGTALHFLSPVSFPLNGALNPVCLQAIVEAMLVASRAGVFSALAAVSIVQGWTVSSLAALRLDHLLQHLLVAWRVVWSRQVSAALTSTDPTAALTVVKVGQSFLSLLDGLFFFFFSSVFSFGCLDVYLHLHLHTHMYISIYAHIRTNMTLMFNVRHLAHACFQSSFGSLAQAAAATLQRLGVGQTEIPARAVASTQARAERTELSLIVEHALRLEMCTVHLVETPSGQRAFEHALQLTMHVEVDGHRCYASQAGATAEYGFEFHGAYEDHSSTITAAWMPPALLTALACHAPVSLRSFSEAENARVVRQAAHMLGRLVYTYPCKAGSPPALSWAFSSYASKQQREANSALHHAQMCCADSGSSGSSTSADHEGKSRHQQRLQCMHAVFAAAATSGAILLCEPRDLDAELMRAVTESVLTLTHSQSRESSTLTQLGAHDVGVINPLFAFVASTTHATKLSDIMTHTLRETELPVPQIRGALKQWLVCRGLAQADTLAEEFSAVFEYLDKYPQLDLASRLERHMRLLAESPEPPESETSWLVLAIRGTLEETRLFFPNHSDGLGLLLGLLPHPVTATSLRFPTRPASSISIAPSIASHRPSFGGAEQLAAAAAAMLGAHTRLRPESPALPPPLHSLSHYRESMEESKLAVEIKLTPSTPLPAASPVPAASPAPSSRSKTARSDESDKQSNGHQADDEGSPSRETKSANHDRATSADNHGAGVAPDPDHSAAGKRADSSTHELAQRTSEDTGAGGRTRAGSEGPLISLTLPSGEDAPADSSFDPLDAVPEEGLGARDVSSASEDASGRPLYEALKARFQAQDFSEFAIHLEFCQRLLPALRASKRVIVAGPAGSGKTTCLQVLSQALTALASSLNPLLGMVEQARTDDVAVGFAGAAFTSVEVAAVHPLAALKSLLAIRDGLSPATSAARVPVLSHLSSPSHHGKAIPSGALSPMQPPASPASSMISGLGPSAVAADPASTWVWLHCDGRVALFEHVHLESMRAASGANIVYETTDLALSSPADFADCTVLVMPTGALSWLALIPTWLAGLPTLCPRISVGNRDMLAACLPRFLACVFAESLLSPVLLCSDLGASAGHASQTWFEAARQSTPAKANFVRSLLSLLGALLRQAFSIESSRVNELTSSRTLVIMCVVRAAVWAFGSACNAGDHRMLDVCLRELLSQCFPSIALPATGTLDEYDVDTTSVAWVPLDSQDFSAALLRTKRSLFGRSYFVHTPATWGCAGVATALLAAGRVPLLVGPRGCGKTTFGTFLSARLPEHVVKRVRFDPLSASAFLLHVEQAQHGEAAARPWKKPDHATSKLRPSLVMFIDDVCCDFNSTSAGLTSECLRILLAEARPGNPVFRRQQQFVCSAELSDCKSQTSLDARLLQLMVPLRLHASLDHTRGVFAPLIHSAFEVFSDASVTVVSQLGTIGATLARALHLTLHTVEPLFPRYAGLDLRVGLLVIRQALLAVNCEPSLSSQPLTVPVFWQLLRRHLLRFVQQLSPKLAEETLALLKATFQTGAVLFDDVCLDDSAELTQDSAYDLISDQRKLHALETFPAMSPIKCERAIAAFLQCFSLPSAGLVVRTKDVSDVARLVDLVAGTCRGRVVDLCHAHRVLSRQQWRNLLSESLKSAQDATAPPLVFLVAQSLPASALDDLFSIFDYGRCPSHWLSKTPRPTLRKLVTPPPCPVFRLLDTDAAYNLHIVWIADGVDSQPVPPVFAALPLLDLEYLPSASECVVRDWLSILSPPAAVPRDDGIVHALAAVHDLIVAGDDSQQERHAEADDSSSSTSASSTAHADEARDSNPSTPRHSNPRLSAPLSQTNHSNPRSSAPLSQTYDGKSFLAASQSPTRALRLFVEQFASVVVTQAARLAERMVASDEVLGLWRKAEDIRRIFSHDNESLHAQLSIVQGTLSALAPELLDLSTSLQQARRLREELERELAQANAPYESLRATEEAELSRVAPLYNGALEAIRSMNKDDINELKSYVSPPAAVMLAVTPVCLLFRHAFKDRVDVLHYNTPEPAWAEARAYLGRDDFFQEMIDYPRESIPDDLLDRVGSIVGDAQYDPSTLSRSSSAVMCVSMWARAMHAFGVVFRENRPLHTQVAHAAALVQSIQLQITARRSIESALAVQCVVIFCSLFYSFSRCVENACA